VPDINFTKIHKLVSEISCLQKLIAHRQTHTAAVCDLVHYQPLMTDNYSLETSSIST